MLQRRVDESGGHAYRQKNLVAELDAGIGEKGQHQWKERGHQKSHPHS